MKVQDPGSCLQRGTEICNFMATLSKHNSHGDVMHLKILKKNASLVCVFIFVEQPDERFNLWLKKKFRKSPGSVGRHAWPGRRNAVFV